MKKVMLYIGGVLLIVVMTVGYHFYFPIKSDTSNLEAHINDWANRGYSTYYQHNINLYDSITIGDLTYIPMELDEKLGYALLEKGIAGRYKINHYAHGSGDFRNGVIESSGHKYLLFSGRNTFGEIARVQFTIDANHEYYINIPTQEVFLVFTEVDNNTKITPVLLDNIIIYNDKGDDITSNINLSGGDIQ